MPVVNRGEVWVIDFGFAAKVRPALLLTANPAADELERVGPTIDNLAQSKRS